MSTIVDKDGDRRLPKELINEIRKLIEYEGENGTITKETVDLLATKKIESIIFELTDNLGKKNIAEALKVLNNLLYSKEPLQKILITLYYNNENYSQYLKL